MATTHSVPDIYPALRYRDATAAIDWLERVFGFRRVFVAPNGDGTVAHAEMSLGNGVIMLGTAKDGDPRPTPGETGIYIRLDDVDGHYARATTEGAEIVRDLNETDYGSKEYSARDPEGHEWSFGTYGVSIPE